MPSAQVLDPLPPDYSSPGPVAPSPSTDRPSAWIRPLLWWKHHHFLRLTLILLAVAATTVAIVSQPHSAANRTAISTPASTKPTPTPNAKLKAEEQAFYAGLPLTQLYYSYAQTTNSSNVFQADPTGDHRRSIDIGLPDRYGFASSPDGQWLLRWNDKVLERSSSTDPQSFTTLFTNPDASARFTSVIWSADSQSVAFTISKPTTEQTGGLGQTYANQVYLQQGQNPAKKIINQTKLFSYHLVSWPSPDKLFYTEDRHDLQTNLTQLNTNTGDVVASYPSVMINSQTNTLVYASDMSWAAGFTATQVTQFNLANQSANPVYSLDTSCPHGSIKKSNNSSITALTINPATGQLIWAVRLDTCSQPKASEQPDTDQLLAAIPGHTPVVFWHGRHDVPVQSLYASPDGQWLRQEFSDTSAQLMQLSSGQFFDSPKIRIQEQQKERTYLIGWLTAAKTTTQTTPQASSSGK